MIPKMTTLSWIGDEYAMLSPQIKATIWVTLFLIVLVIVIRIIMEVKHYGPDKPATGLILLVESFVKLMNNFSKEMMGKRWRFFAPYFISLAMFLFAANISGLFGFTPPTSSISVTGTLALITFIFIQVFGIISTGPKQYIKDICSPIPMTPMNIIGEIATPLSLAFRLFGNILSGVILTGLVYGFFGWYAVIATPFLHAIFDIAFGLIQTLVFVILSAVNIANKFSENEFENIN